MLTRFAGSVFHVIDRPTDDRTDKRFWEPARTACGRHIGMPFPVHWLSDIPLCKQCDAKAVR